MWHLFISWLVFLEISKLEILFCIIYKKKENGKSSSSTWAQVALASKAALFENLECRQNKLFTITQRAIKKCCWLLIFRNCQFIPTTSNKAWSARSWCCFDCNKLNWVRWSRCKSLCPYSPFQLPCTWLIDGVPFVFSCQQSWFSRKRTYVHTEISVGFSQFD